jgi:hypothetical protein
MILPTPLGGYPPDMLKNRDGLCHHLSSPGITLGFDFLLLTKQPTNH